MGNFRFKTIKRKRLGMLTNEDAQKAYLIYKIIKMRALKNRSTEKEAHIKALLHIEDKFSLSYSEASAVIRFHQNPISDV